MELLIAIACGAALVWGAVALLRGSVLVGCVLFVLVGSCFGREFVHFEAGPVVLTLDRLLLPVLLAAFVLQRRLGRTDPKPINAADVVLLTLLFYLAVSTFTHDFRLKFPGQVPPVYRLLAGYGFPALVYFVARQSRIESSGLSAMHALLLVFGLYLSFTGLMEITRQWWLVFPKYIADPKLSIHFGRARGPMLTSVTFGFCVTVSLLSAWVWHGRASAWGRLCIWLLVPLSWGAIYASYTRSVWMGAALSVFILLAVTLQGRVRAVVLSSMLVAGLLLSVGRMGSLVELKRESTASETRESTTMRASFAYVSWQMFLERPVTGVGFGHFHHAKWPYLSDRSTTLHLEAIRPLVHHNTLLSLLTETGIIGLGLFLALLGCWIRDALAVLRSSLASDWARREAALFLAALGTYCCQLLFHELSYSPLDNSLLFLLAGVATGLKPMAVTAAGSVDSASLPTADDDWFRHPAPKFV